MRTQHRKNSATPENSQVVRLALSVDEAAESMSLSKSGLYALMKGGRLPFIKIGARRLIRISDLEHFLAGPEAA